METLDLEKYTNQDNPEYESDSLTQALMARKRRNSVIRMSKEDRRSLATRIVQDFFDASATNQMFRANHVEFMNNWRGTPSPNPTGPLGEQSANVKVPLTSTFVEQWKARLAKIIFGDPDGVKFYSLISPLQEDQLKELAQWFWWELINIVEFPKHLNDIFHYCFVDGIALPIPYYDRVIERKLGVREFELDITANIAAQLDAGIRQIFDSMGQQVIQILPDVEEGTFQVTCKDCENPAYVSCLIDGETIVFELEYDDEIFDGVKIELPNLQDVIIVNTNETPDALPFFGIRSFLNVVELDTLVERGVFNISTAEFENVIAFASDKTSDFIPQQVSREEDIVEGADSFGSAYVRGNDYERRWVEIYRWEGTVWYKGRRTEIAVWLAPRSYTILRMVLLEELNKDGKRSPVKCDFIRVPGRFYSIGLSEWLRHVQTEMDAVHNFRLNSAFISTVPYGFYSPLAGMPQTILSLRPGQLYPVKDPQGVNFPNMNWSPVWGFNEESLIRKYASELAGMGDPGLGSFTSKRTSASEFVGTAQAIDIRTEYIAKGLLRSVEQLLYRIFGLYQQHSKGERVFQIAGPDGKDIVKRLSMDKIQGKLKLQLTGNVRQLSKDIERQTALSMMSVLLNQFSLMMGIVKPDTVYAAIKKVMEASDYTGVPIHMPDMPPDSPAPAEELKLMMAGIYPSPHMGENFGEHLQAHTITASRPDLDKMMSPESLQMLQRHIMETMQMQQQVMMMRQANMILAQQQQAQMAKQGVRPGEAGTAEAESQPGTQEEGVGGAAPMQSNQAA